MEARERKEKEELEARERKETEEYNRERERVREDRECAKELEEIAERRERDEREHRVKIEELALRRLEIERSRVNNASNEPASSSNLPKIQLIKFDGTVEKYQEFWDNFQTLVDCRTDLADNVKLHYLKGQLVGKAASLVEGFRITDDNYKVAKDVLKDEYGSSQVVQNKIYYEILRMKLYSDKQCHVEEFYRKLEINLKLLENQGVDVNSNEFLASNLFMKLPDSIQKRLVREKGSVITVKDIREQIIVELRCDRLLKSLNPELGKPKYESISKPVMSVPKPPVRPRYTTEALVSIDRPRPSTVCVYCDGSHYSDECDRYRTVDARKEKLGNRCFICLLPGHLSGYCRLEYRCWHCSRFNVHHRSLCPKKCSSGSKNDTQHRANALLSDSDSRKCRNSTEPGPSNSKSCLSLSTPDKSVPRPWDKCNDIDNTMVSTVSCAVNSVVFMQTAVVNVYDEKNDQFIAVRALLDTASSHSYMSDRLLKVLDLNVGHFMSMNVYTFGALEPKKMKAPEVTIKIVANDMQYDLNVFVVPNIVRGGNVRAYDTEFLRGVDESFTLADRFLLDKPTQEFDLLIGVDYYAHFILSEKVKIDNNLFVWQTAFGYVLSGTKCNELVQHEDTVSRSVLFTRTELTFDHTHDIQKFWDLQTLGIKDNCSVSDDDLALQSFHSTLKFENDRYYVDFPWKNDSRDVQSNFGLAVGRLKSLVKRHQKDGILGVCEKTLADQLEKGVLEKVPNEDLNKKSCYFPFHAVIRESVTTQVRFVMDASARQNRSKPSLNDMLYRGPVLLENLCSLLLRFRLGKYGLISDIEKAFLNIGLNDSERDFTRIVWLKDVTKPIDQENISVLRHTRLPFGVVSSPFLLSCVIRTHLAKYTGDHIEKLRNNIYMDNILCAVDSVSEIGELVGTARKVFSEASLNLREWSSNSLDYITTTLSPDLVNTSKVQKTLGMLWDTREDTLSLKFNYQYKNEVVCKRLLLSVLASFFDILGLWTPIIMHLKLLVQSAWVQKKDWDEELDSKDKVEFLRIVESMNRVSNMPVQRYLVNCNSQGSVRYELHAFSDACSHSYASVVYLRRETQTGEINTDVVFAKSRVAPTDKPTLPRLELLGALIAYRSLNFVKNSLMNVTVDKFYLWIDNQCVIHWLTGNKVLPVFINNRVREIKSSTFPITFRYVPTEQNPADLACRGSSDVDLKDNKLWWEGPGFLSTHVWPDFDFHCPFICDETDENEIPIDINLITKCAETVLFPTPFDIDEHKYNSFKKLVNITCYVKKFINLCRKGANFKGPISLEEYNNSKAEWLKYIQRKKFPTTYEKLALGQSDQLSTQLGLELSDDGLLICKGRFRELRYEGKEVFPVLIPRQCHLTDIIVNDVHRACFHNGTGQTLATLRLNYWLCQGRSEVKKIIRNCVNCKKFRQGPYKQPEFCFYPNYRVQRNVAFQYSSVDMFGPLTVKEGNKVSTVHGLIFVCMTTRAIHLEMLDSESTADFLLAFKRFLARRNACRHILSDNAIQFKLVKDVFSEVLNEKSIKFQFTSPLSPWEGGLYERLIGSTKQCLRKTIGHELLSKTQLLTTLIEIENVINKRPLGYVGDEDIMITPSHFLGIKSDSLGLEQLNFNSRGKSVTFKNLMDLWKKGSSLLDLFWRTWVKQYLNALRERKQTALKQGRISTLEPKVGEVVLIKDTNLHRANWPYGSILKLNHGRDEKVRNVDLKIPNGRIITRPVSMLYPLEI
uniref:Integrase catalytic domain-containing protein n=1 Tax=Cacopsylla melanoneura TaxID=428564 RepID=A0A8D8YQ79_9HEMI